MALIGRPSSHTFQTFAENQERSPWEPYHVSAGFDAADSCVTVSTAMSHTPGAVTIFGGGAVDPWTPQMILDNIVDAIARGRGGMTVWKLGSVKPSPQRHNLILHPELAVELDRLGFTRRSLGEHLYGRTSIPYEDLTSKEKLSVERRLFEGEIPQSSMQAYRDGLKEGGKVPLLLSPEDCHIFVAGGAPGYSFGTSYFSIPPYAVTSILTKRICGAALTGAGR